MSKKEQKILLFDIETAPNLSYVWGQYEQNVIAHEKEWYVLCWVAKWLGDKKFITSALPDFRDYKIDRENDFKVVKELWHLLDEAEIVIAHNGDRFDIKKMNARFAYYGLNPPSPYKTIDTYKVAKKYFSFNSNSLNDLGSHLQLGAKISTGGFSLWKGCMSGDIKSWRKMINYNKQDVLLLEKVYLELRKWITNHPSVSIFEEKEHNCPTCGSDRIQKRGFGVTKISKYQRFQCQECGSWSKGKSIRTLVEIR